MRRRRQAVLLGVSLFWGIPTLAASDENQKTSPPDPELIAAARQILHAMVAAAEADLPAAVRQGPAAGGSVRRGRVRAGRPVAGRRSSDGVVRPAGRPHGKLDEASAGRPRLLLALGVALDTSATLRTHPTYTDLIRSLETDDERRLRLRVLGEATMRGRRDLTQHFFVSGFLAALHGPGVAEAAGVAKELLDAHGGSGFSFADLAADLAGTAFAVRVLDQRLTCRELAAGFTIEAFLPDVSDLAEGLSWEEFCQRFGSPLDRRYREQLKRIRDRVEQLPGYADPRPTAAPAENPRWPPRHLSEGN